ncbi:MAG: methyltransferase domain-containing protein [Acidimicrobiia bacterium]
MTVAQAIHWFDPPRALTELRRVLRPGGRLGVIGNHRDRSVHWVNALWTIIDRVERDAPWRSRARTPLPHQRVVEPTHVARSARSRPSSTSRAHRRDRALYLTPWTNFSCSGRQKLRA